MARREVKNINLDKSCQVFLENGSIDMREKKKKGEENQEDYRIR